MTSGLTPMKDLQREEDFGDTTEPDFFPSGLTKIKKIKLSLKDTKTLTKHLTYEQIENLRLRKNKRLFIMQIKKLQQVFFELGLETQLINKGNEELREISFKEMVGVVNSATNIIKKKKQKVEELTKGVKERERLLDHLSDKLVEKVKVLNLVEKRQLEEKEKNKRNDELIKKRQESIKKAKKLIKQQKKQQKLNLELSEINFKVSEKRVAEVDTIYEDIDNKQRVMSHAQEQIKTDRLSIKKKEEHLKTREIAVKDKEDAVRRLIEEARRAGIVF